MAEFDVGVVVQLKSGGPKMTCKGEASLGSGEVHCQWFAGSKLEYGYFPSKSLVVIDEKEAKSK